MPSRRRSLLAIAALALICSCTATAHATARKLRLVNRAWGTGEIRVVLDGHEQVLERYAAPIRVQATEVSSDGRTAFVWYYSSRPPLQLAIYDLRSMQRTARFAPGFGGEIHFTPAGNIVHRWGCGSNCHELALYDLRGKTLLRGWGSDLEISPGGRFAVTGPSIYRDDEAITVYDLDSARRIFRSRPRRGESILLDDVRWSEREGLIELDVAQLRKNSARHVTVRAQRKSP